SLSLTADGKTLVLANARSSLSLWDMATRKKLKMLAAKDRIPQFTRLTTTEFTSDGKTLAAGYCNFGQFGGGNSFQAVGTGLPSIALFETQTGTFIRHIL